MQDERMIEELAQLLADAVNIMRRRCSLDGDVPPETICDAWNEAEAFLTLWEGK